MINHSPKEIIVIKASGKEELFNENKLRHSLKNSGASESTINDILENITSHIRSGTTTKQIYQYAFDLLNHNKHESATRYALKQAILELGPTGYPFERFMGKLFEKQGFKTEVGVIVEGNCVSHEVDVIATCKHSQYLIECKYSMDQGKNVNVQVPLYVRSRMDDIIQKRKNIPEYKSLTFSGWIVTNTRFSDDSIEFGRCSGLHLIGWDFPQGNGLKEMIEQTGIYPITILSTLTKNQKQALIDKGIVVCNQLINQKNTLQILQLNPKKQQDVTNEINAISNKSNINV